MTYTTMEDAKRQAAERERRRNPPADDMTMRDYFAAQAMKQTMLEFDMDGDWEKHAYDQDTFLLWAAQRAYAMADAMLKARVK